MEILQTSQFLFFVGQSLQPCSRLSVELQHSKRLRVEVGENWKEYILNGKVNWPGKAVLDEAGRFKVQLPKRREKDWDEPGKEADDIPQDFYRFKIHPREAYPVTILKIRRFKCPAVCELTLSHQEKVYHHFYVGNYFCIYMRMKGKRSKVPFYPTLFFPFYNLTYPNKHVREYQFTSRPLRVLINDYYREDSFQNRLCNTLKENTTIYMSYPKGGFCPSFLKDHNKINVLAETIGIGPALSIALYALQLNPILTVSVFYFYQQEVEIIYKEELEDMAKRESRFEVVFVYKQRRKGGSGWRGAVQPSLLKNYITSWNGLKAEYGILAGHRQFVFPLATWLVTDYYYPNTSVYRFITV